MGFLGGLGTIGIIDYKAENCLTPEAKATMELEKELKNTFQTYAFNELEAHQKAVEQYTLRQEDLENRMTDPDIKDSIGEYNEHMGNMRIPTCIAVFCGMYGFILGLVEVHSDRKKRELAAKKEY